MRLPVYWTTFLRVAATDLKFGIPDIELVSSSGSKLNPSAFAGHQLIALFCPTDVNASDREIAAYRHHSAELVARDAWLIVFAQRYDSSPNDEARVLTFPDLEGHAWAAFRNLTPHPEEMDRDHGAIFLFTRGGCLHAYWQGAGHVGEVLAELGSPSAQSPYQIRG